jgi:hypothetical protein
MRSLRKIFLALFFVVLASGSTAMAEGRQDFALTNKTGYDIHRVFVSPSSADDWEDDVLGEDVLGNGETVNIHFSRASKACKWDLMVVYEDESEATWEDFDLCTVSKIIVKYNARTRETSAEYQ